MLTPEPIFGIFKALFSLRGKVHAPSLLNGLEVFVDLGELLFQFIACFHGLTLCVGGSGCFDPFNELLLCYIGIKSLCAPKQRIKGIVKHGRTPIVWRGNDDCF